MTSRATTFRAARRAALLGAAAMLLLTSAAWADPPVTARSAFGMSVPSGPDGDGGAAGLSAAEVAALRKAREALKAIVAEGQESIEVRVEAVGGLARLHEALSDWGHAGQLDWYVDMVFATAHVTLRRELVWGMLSAAKGNGHHAAGLAAVWGALRKKLAAGGEEPRYLQDISRPLARGGLLGRSPKALAATLECSDRPMILRPPDLNLAQERSLRALSLLSRPLDLASYLRLLPEETRD